MEDAAPLPASGMITWIASNKGICWTIFWFGWFFISPETIIPGSIAVGVGLVIYKERAVNLVTICAAYLGILAYLALGHNLAAIPENVRLWMGMGGIVALVILGKRFPMFGLFLIIMITSAFSRGGRCRRW